MRGWWVAFVACALLVATPAAGNTDKIVGEWAGTFKQTSSGRTVVVNVTIVPSRLGDDAGDIHVLVPWSCGSEVMQFNGVVDGTYEFAIGDVNGGSCLSFKNGSLAMSPTADDVGLNAVVRNAKGKDVISVRLRRKTD